MRAQSRHHLLPHLLCQRPRLPPWRLLPSLSAAPEPSPALSLYSRAPTPGKHLDIHQAETVPAQSQIVKFRPLGDKFQCEAAKCKSKITPKNFGVSFALKKKVLSHFTLFHKKMSKIFLCPKSCLKDF